MSFIGYKITKILSNNFGYANYLPFCGSFLWIFVGIALFDGNESYKNQIVGWISFFQLSSWQNSNKFGIAHLT